MVCGVMGYSVPRYVVWYPTSQQEYANTHVHSSQARGWFYVPNANCGMRGRAGGKGRVVMRGKGREGSGRGVLLRKGTVVRRKGTVVRRKGTMVRRKGTMKGTMVEGKGSCQLWLKKRNYG
ncbi:hypothetical protein GMDG_02595 [Pseudogymnoascus destructans 20631-21]|uniref:Uncharacterized protein n=1 Tax=Pseudogymnoascus destructans (strain ATCC MYA-4855 / 20631-21) TaxID=658429 RepID=L8G4B0_PSED2|nr:hypothetical protein GMDG_02595 [Pseudogymnoascus destructans 20631-21]